MLRTTRDTQILGAGIFTSNVNTAHKLAAGLLAMWGETITEECTQLFPLVAIKSLVGEFFGRMG